MKEELNGIVEAISKRQNHFLLLSGNIYDRVRFNDWRFDDVADFLVQLTSKKFSQCIKYDLFSGIELVRGDAESIKAAMGIKSPEVMGGKAEKGRARVAAKLSDQKLIESLQKAQTPSGSAFPVNPLELFPCLDTLFTKCGVPTVVIMDHADTLAPAGMQNVGRQNERVAGIALMKWAKSLPVRKNGHLIVLLCRVASDIDDDILDRSFEGLQFRISKPDEKERADYFRANGAFNEKTLSAMAKATSGLALKELEPIAEYSKSEKDHDHLLASVFSAKGKILQDEYGDLLEIMRVRNGFEAIGGLEKPIAKLRSVASAMREGKTSVVPQGVLFMGPPGTGKTVLAEAFAKEAGLNFVKPRDIKNMWVGESERRMTKFLDAIKDLSPVAVFIDEFDQSQGQRGGFDGDSGVTRGLFKKMLEVMSDTSLRGKILWILATNRPDLIDPAMKRAGRCDLRIPFLSPDIKQLALICKAGFNQYPDMKSGIKDWSQYAKRSEGYTGADMIEVVRRAWEHACGRGSEEITPADMEFACGDYRPQTMDRPQALRMSLLAIVECSSKTLLPDDCEKLCESHLSELTGRKLKLRRGANFNSLVARALSHLPPM